ncbi:MAG: dTDP-4-dehydrorhamnose 3,5-epimerase [Thermodesulforhabdaceae bacterium]
MKKSSTPIDGLLVLEPRVFEDNRGFFYESYNEETFRHLGINDRFVQDNHSGSRKGVIRGLHYQICHPQAKLVRVLVGEIFDVAVDIRRSSPTFGKWFGINLSAENKKQLYIPAGFAHGFLVLSDWAEVLYKTSDFYAPECDRVIVWNDPTIGIQWPLDGLEPILSEKDARGVRLEQADLF